MASFSDMSQIADRSITQRRVEYCLKKAAIAIMAEDAGTANHAERVVYANKVLEGTASISEACKAVVTNATLTAGGDLDAGPLFGISDNDLEFTVNSMVNALAGVST